MNTGRRSIVIFFSIRKGATNLCDHIKNKHKNWLDIVNDHEEDHEEDHDEDHEEDHEEDHLRYIKPILVLIFDMVTQVCCALTETVIIILYYIISGRI